MFNWGGAQRTRELGVRLALGAQRRNIMDILLAQASKLLLAGAIIGVGLAFRSSRVLASLPPSSCRNRSRSCLLPV